MRKYISKRIYMRLKAKSLNKHNSGSLFDKKLGYAKKLPSVHTVQ